MYLQITNRCNMSCEHCGMNCTKQGEDMTPKTFENAMDYADGYLSLGGGEPTIHPLFWRFLGLAIAHAEETIWLATNGSVTDTAIALAKMARKGVISCALSQDSYHDPIDERVIKAFTEGKKQTHSYSDAKDSYDFREIRNVEDALINAGRCDFGEDGCVCEDIIVKPNGDVVGCGCDCAPCFGNVNSTVCIPNDWDWCGCSRNQVRPEELRVA